ncbi:DUF1080 domain-containing protein [Thioalkalivibrio sp. XN8]|uniref:3-keto-disaccharide hydrolase n=1 Tax=Thioalkalivibrio sp. XN8 TaxID=2712863 RepID=UPI0013EC3CA8|nr:DUF1080 domain-containing protein [Thioalkalivibrio sp. XN8]NGP54531.1 DUF1080 domain-containing protein [Thioalkalivibrio sp. XN8]
MKVSLRAAIAAGALLAGGFTSASIADDWITLIEGEKGLENFNSIGDANWRAEDGAILADHGAGGHLVTKSAYQDVEVYAEFWADHTTNSGIFLRAQNPEQIGFANAYEVNIFDQRPVQEYSTGAIVGFAALEEPFPKAGGKWNTFEIRIQGSEAVVELNGQVTVRMANDDFKEGPISLQYAAGAGGIPGGVIKWRKVMIRPLS